MGCALSYGIDSSVGLDLPAGALVGECGRLSIGQLDDPADATAKALAEPIEYPALDRFTMPGDRVAIVVGSGVPQGERIAAAVVRRLADGGIDPDSVSVLRTDADADSADRGKWLAEDLRDGPRVITHDPADRKQLAYLATSDRGHGILLNKAIIDADIVLPIGCFHDRYVAGHYGIHTAVFPGFADQKNQKRFRSPKTLSAQGYHKKSVVSAVDEVGWLLGTTFTIQVIPGPGGSVLHVLAGEVVAVEAEARRLYRAAWHFSVPRRASLVLAAIEGNSQEQTWENVGRALASAAGLVEDGGAIAICSELADPPGPAVDLLQGARSRDDAFRRIVKERPRDALAAAQLVAIQERVSVFLLSRLDPAPIEELQIAPIAETEELLRLAGRHPSCLVLGNAPLATATIEEDE